MLGSRVGRLNPAWNEADAKPDEQFQKAMAVTGEEMEAIVKQVHTYTNTYTNTYTYTYT